MFETFWVLQELPFFTSNSLAARWLDRYEACTYTDHSNRFDSRTDNLDREMIASGALHP